MHIGPGISALKNSVSYNVGIYSRRIADSSGLDFRHDFSPYFDGRKPQPNAYSDIETALLDTATLLLKAHRNPTLNVEGMASLPLGILYGAVFSPLAGFTLNWKQTLRGVSDANWSLSQIEPEYAVKAERTLGSLESQDIVLALGVNADIESAVSMYLREQSLNPRAYINVSPPQGALKQGEALSPGEATALALRAVDEVRTAKADLRMPNVTLHIFAACPLGLAVLLGQKLNTIGKIVLYEHAPGEQVPYHRAHEFSPSTFSFGSSLLNFGAPSSTV